MKKINSNSNIPVAKLSILYIIDVQYLILEFLYLFNQLEGYNNKVSYYLVNGSLTITVLICIWNISPMISLFQRRISTKCAQNGFDIIFCKIYEPIALSERKVMCHSQWFTNTRCEMKTKHRYTWMVLYMTFNDTKNISHLL